MLKFLLAAKSISQKILWLYLANDHFWYSTCLCYWATLSMCLSLFNYFFFFHLVQGCSVLWFPCSFGLCHGIMFYLFYLFISWFLKTVKYNNGKLSVNTSPAVRIWMAASTYWIHILDHSLNIFLFYFS